MHRSISLNYKTLIHSHICEIVTLSKFFFFFKINAEFKAQSLRHKIETFCLLARIIITEIVIKWGCRKVNVCHVAVICFLSRYITSSTIVICSRIKKNHFLTVSVLSNFPVAVEKQYKMKSSATQ